jgi:hemoglobin
VKKVSLLALAVAAVVGTACGGASSGPAMESSVQKPTIADKSLYERLGGLEAIKAVVDDFVANVAANPAINARFANTDIPEFKQKLVDQICEATGGPCKYTGKNMVESHTGMKISHAEFDSLVVDLKKTLDKFKVPDREQNELLGALGGMRPEIVNK